MNKGLAIAIATGAIFGIVAVNAPATDAFPAPGNSPTIRVVAQNQTQNQTSTQVQSDDWQVPDLNDRAKGEGLKPVVGDDGKPVIQVALLLDTSGSMSSLIDQAKTELWSIVNKLDGARYKGQKPRIEVALYEYGKSTLARDEGYIRQLAPFTHDLDGLSEILFSLQTNGGDEYCAWVIRSAIDSLKWKHRKGSLRMVFVAGNEPFNQGPVEVGPVLKDANEKGLLVHPIYCSDGNSSDRVSWESAADLAHTDLKIIDHTRVASVPKTPYDARINELNGALNKTYIGYGVDGGKNMERQQAQDANMAGIGASASAERAVAKASAAYSNESWDLVDRAKADGGLGGLEESALPPEMKSMSKKEREEYVAEKAEERSTIQNEIQELNRKRQQFIAEYQRDNSQAAATLGEAVINTVRTKAGKEGFDIQ